jgi:hypothetical protein
MMTEDMDDNLKNMDQMAHFLSKTEKLIITVFWDVTLCSLEHVH